MIFHRIFNVALLIFRENSFIKSIANSFFINLVIFLMITGLISSCSFDDKISTYIGTELCSVEILLTDESTAQKAEQNFHFVENAKKLFCKMNNLDKKYILEVSFTEEKQPLILQENSDILRENIEILTKYSLLEKKSGKKIHHGKFRLVSSYNTLFSPYSTHLEENDACIYLYRSVAEELRLKLISYFHSAKTQENLSK